MPRRDIPDAVRSEIEQAIRDGGSCRGIARDFDVSPGYVSKLAKALQVPDAFVRQRSQTKSASRAPDGAAKTEGPPERAFVP